jgi:hypothetical protein
MFAAAIKGFLLRAIALESITFATPQSKFL